jgi:hypothetical protein
MLDPGLIRQIKAGSEQDVMALNSTMAWLSGTSGACGTVASFRDYFRALGIRHPDMTALLLITFWRHLNDQPLQVEDEVARLEAANTAGIWKPDPQCRCEASGPCAGIVHDEGDGPAALERMPMVFFGQECTNRE